MANGEEEESPLRRNRKKRPANIESGKNSLRKREVRTLPPEEGARLEEDETEMSML